METKEKKSKPAYIKILKWAGISFLILLTIIVALPFLFKGKIVEMVKVETNKQLNAKINFSDIDFSLISSFPRFKLKINNLCVAGINKFERDTLINLSSLSVELDLMSVINGDNYKIESIELSKPKIYAHVLENLKANWDITKPSTDTIVADTSTTRFKLALKSFEIEKGDIRYNDESMNFDTRLENLNLSLKGDFTQDNFLMDIKTEIEKFNMTYEGIHYLNNVKTSLALVMDMDMPNFKFTFKENEVKMNELSLTTTGFVAMPKDDIEMDLQFNCPSTEFKSILSLIPKAYTQDFATVKTAGKMSLKGFAKGIYNDATMPAFGCRLEIADAMFKYPSVPKSVNNIQILLDVNSPSSDFNQMKIDLEKFHAEMAGNPVDMTLHVKTPITDPDIDGTVKGKIVLQSVKEFIPLDKGDDLSGTITSDISMKGKMSMIEQEKYDEFQAAGKFQVNDMHYSTPTLPFPVLIKNLVLNFNPKEIELAAFESQMGKTDVTASGKIQNLLQYVFKDSLLQGNFNYRSANLDLDELMGPETTDTATTTADTIPLSVIPVPANLDFTLNAFIGKIKYDNLDITNSAGIIQIKNERITMENLKVNLLDGSVTMTGYYDTKNKKNPDIHYNLEINELDIQKTFAAFNTVQKLAPIGKYAFGKFSTSLKDLTGKLDEQMMPDLNSLTASGAMRTKAVRVEGFEPIVKLAENLKNDNLKKMELQNIAAFFHIKNGRVTIDPFKTKIKNMDAEISGSTGYDQTIDYTWNLKIPTKDLPAQASNVVEGWLSKAGSMAGKEIKLPEKIDVTALIGGTVTKPVIKTGMKDAMKDVKNEVKEEIKEIIEEKKEELISNAKEEAAKEAEKILTQAKAEADKIKAEAEKLSEQVKKEGYDKADQLEKSGGNPIEKIANKKLAEKLRKETDQKCQKITDEANAKADKIISEAQQKADKIKQP
jgi:hypothetical protein